MCVQADVSRLRSLGWVPRYTLEAGLREQAHELAGRCSRGAAVLSADGACLLQGTGFKGTWLCKVARSAGSARLGFSLPPDGYSLYPSAGLSTASRACTAMSDWQAFHAAYRAFGPKLCSIWPPRPSLERLQSIPARRFVERDGRGQ